MAETKDETATRDAERLAAQRRAEAEQAEKNRMATKVAAASRKMPSDPEQQADKLVSVRAFERAGFSGFSRAGQVWPSTMPGKLAYVTPRMLAALKAEPMLKVDESPDTSGVDLKSLKEQTGYDVPVRELVDENALAIEEVDRVNREIKALDARRKAQARIAVLERLRKGEDVPQHEIDDAPAPGTAAARQQDAKKS